MQERLANTLQIILLPLSAPHHSKKNQLKTFKALLIRLSTVVNTEPLTPFFPDRRQVNNGFYRLVHVLDRNKFFFGVDSMHPGK